MSLKQTGLRKTQQAIAALVTGEQPGSSLRFLKPVRRHAKLADSQNLGVYRYAYFYRLMTTLSYDFQAISLIVGKQVFQKIAHDYLRAFPPSGWSLHEIGEFFGRFLKKHPSAKERPFLSELARFEWAILEAARAADKPGYLRRLSFHWPVDTIRECALAGRPLIPVLPKRTMIEIQKKNLRVNHRRV